MSPFEDDQLALARSILEKCRIRGWTLATAESCTGGLIAACFTDNAGSSDVFDRGFVTYSNVAKQDLLGVKFATLQRFGAVSTETALEMAVGALAASRASLAVSVTGIAGPGGGSPDKPVGLVCFGVATAWGQNAQEYRFGDIGRSAVRSCSLSAALHLVSETLASRP